jgi:hypothetical protein
MTKMIHILTSSVLVSALGFSSAYAAVLVNLNTPINSPNNQSALTCLTADNSSNSCRSLDRSYVASLSAMRRSAPCARGRDGGGPLPREPAL